MILSTAVYSSASKNRENFQFLITVSKTIGSRCHELPILFGVQKMFNIFTVSLLIDDKNILDIKRKNPLSYT